MQVELEEEKHKRDTNTQKDKSQTNGPEMQLYEVQSKFWNILQNDWKPIYSIDDQVY